MLFWSKDSKNGGSGGSGSDGFSTKSLKQSYKNHRQTQKHPSKKLECPSCHHMNYSSAVNCQKCGEKLYVNCYDESKQLQTQEVGEGSSSTAII